MFLYNKRTPYRFLKKSNEKMGAVSDFLNVGAQLQINKENQENALEMQERNFYFNEQSANNAFRRQKQFYEAYQTPMAMRRMLEEAGYSKELYGGQLGSVGGVSGQGAGNTGTASVSQAPTFSFDPIQELKTIAETENLKEDARTKKIENDAKEGRRTEEYNTEVDTKNQGLKLLASQTENEGLKGEIMKIQKEDANVTLMIKNATKFDEIQLAGEKVRNMAKQTEKLVSDMQTADYDLKYKKKFAGVMFATAVNQNLLLGQQIISEKYSRNMGEKMYNLAKDRLGFDKEIGWAHYGNEKLGLTQDLDKFTYTLEQTAEQFSEKMDQQEREMWWQNVRAVLGIARFVNINEAGANQMPKYHPSRGRF